MAGISGDENKSTYILCNNVFFLYVYTGCGNIASFFIMRGNQAVEVVAG